jgi:hypothetical protein
MKRNRVNTQSNRLKKTTKGKSKYAAKLASGNQMYGPGCCAHKRKSRVMVEEAA